MKKIIFITAVLFCSINVLNAQPNDSVPKNKKKYYHAIEATGFYNFTQRNSWGGGIHEINGIQFNSHLALGLGIGFHYFENYYTTPKMNFFMFPVYLNFKYTILKKIKWSPFLMVDFGYIAVYEKFKTSGNGYWEHGLTSTISLGYNCKFKETENLYIGIGCEIFMLCPSLKIGFQFK
ncbi:MAG: hypothetical protein RR034_06215 [Bacteroidales bacterium]